MYDQATTQPWAGGGRTACDGTNVLDQNTAGQSGYRCRYQVGSFNLTTNAVTAPAYMFANACSGLSFGCTGGIAGSFIVGNISAKVTANREYYNSGAVQTSSSSPFDGTSGIGWGTIANRPATCTPGTAYWATDEGEWDATDGAGTPWSHDNGASAPNGADGKMYRCTATNTWNARFGPNNTSNTTGLPLTYPHPLQSGGQAPPNGTPVVSITSPTANTVTTEATVTLSGTCVDDGGCSNVTWVNSLTTDTTPAAVGAGNWSITDAALDPGVNPFTVTGSDGTLTGQATVNVLRETCSATLPYTQGYGLGGTAANWAGRIPCTEHYGSGADFSIVSNKGQSNANIRDIEVVSQASLNTNQYSQVTISDVASGVKQLAVCINMAGNDGQDDTKTGYFFQVDGTNSPYNLVGRFNGVNGFDHYFAITGSGIPNITVVPGTTTIKLENVDGVGHAYVDDVEIWSGSLTFGGVTFTGGKAGVCAYGIGTQWDDLEVGNVSAPSDTEDPVVTITDPSSSGSATVGFDTTELGTGQLAGTVTDDTAPTACSYTNNTDPPGDHATSLAAGAWANQEAIPLAVGLNTITVTCVDAAANDGVAIVVVNRLPDEDPTPPVRSKGRRWRVVP